MAGNQQAMRVHAVRRAGHQRQPVLARHDLQQGDIVRLDHVHAIHLVSQRLSHHCDVHEIAFAQLVEAREHQRVRQATVSGDHRMGAFAANGQTRAIQMTGTDGKHLFGSTMPYRQFDADTGNKNRAHDARARIKQSLVFLVAGSDGFRGTTCFRGERIHRLSQNRLPMDIQTAIVRMRAAQHLRCRRVRPSFDRARHRIGYRPHPMRRARLHRRRKQRDGNGADDQQRRNATDDDIFRVAASLSANHVGDINHFPKWPYNEFPR